MQGTLHLPPYDENYEVHNYLRHNFLKQLILKLEKDINTNNLTLRQII